MEKCTVVNTRKNIAMVVFTIGNEIHFTPLEKYNPYVMDARAPKFTGSFDDCVKYLQDVI